MSFPLDALTSERSFCEKLLALRRASQKSKGFLAARIRHLYDIFQLYEHDHIKRFIQGVEFENMLLACYQDDELNQKISQEIGLRFSDCELFSKPGEVINSVKDSYHQLRHLAFDNKLPRIEDTIVTVENICDRLKGFIFHLKYCLRLKNQLGFGNILF